MKLVSRVGASAAVVGAGEAGCCAVAVRAAESSSRKVARGIECMEWLSRADEFIL